MGTDDRTGKIESPTICDLDSSSNRMQYLPTMVRVTDLDASLRCYRDALLEHNWGSAPYSGGRSFGHGVHTVDDLHAACEPGVAHGVVIHQPARDGRMAFVGSPDGIPVEWVQAGRALALAEPWASIPNVGTW